MAAPLTSSGITYEQAGGAGYSQGLALQGIVPQHKDLFLAEQRRRQQAEAKAAEEEKRAIEKWGEDIDVKGVHQLDLLEAKADAAKTFDDLVTNYHNYSLTKKQKVLQEFAFRQMQRTERKKDLETKEAVMKQYSDSPVMTKALSAMQGGTYADLEKLAQSPENRYGEFNYNPQNRTLELMPIEKIDTSAQEKQMIGESDRIKMTEKEINRVSAEGVPKKYIRQYAELPMTISEANAAKETLIGSTGFPAEGQPPSAEGKAIIALQDDRYRRRKQKELFESGRLPKNYFEMNAAEANVILTMETAKDIHANSKVAVTERLIPGVAKEDEEAKKSGAGFYINNKIQYSANTLKDIGLDTELSQKAASVLLPTGFNIDITKNYDVVKLTKPTGEPLGVRDMPDPKSNSLIPVKVQYYLKKGDKVYVIGHSMKKEEDGTYKTEEKLYVNEYSKVKGDMPNFDTPEIAFEKVSKGAYTTEGKARTEPKEPKTTKQQLSLKEYNRVKKKNISKEALQKAFGDKYEITD